MIKDGIVLLSKDDDKRADFEEKAMVLVGGSELSLILRKIKVSSVLDLVYNLVYIITNGGGIRWPFK